MPEGLKFLTHLLVTGARGAIGRHLVRDARSQGYTTTGIGHGAWLDDESLPAIDGWINGGVDGDNLSANAKLTGAPDLIVHLAGGSAVGPSIQHPGEDFRRTVESSQHLLEWVRTSAPATTRLVFVSSAAVYGDGHQTAIAETSPLNPTSPYGAHKAIVEMLCRSYARQFGLKIAIVRPFSVFGPGLKKQLIWELASRLCRGERRVTLAGTGQEQRDFLPMSNVTLCLLHAGELASDLVPTINGCTGRATKVEDVAKLVAAEFEGACVAFSGQVRAGDPGYLVGDPSYAAACGFEARIDLPQEIAKTIRWIRDSLPPAAKRD